MKPEDINNITEDINNVIDWLSKKEFCDRDKKEYNAILEKIGKKYGTLMLKVTGEHDYVKSSTNIDTKNGTSVFCDEEDESIFEKIQDEEFGFVSQIDEELKKELIELRNNIIESCNYLMEFIANYSTKIDKDHLTELKDYVDDILLWIYVQEKITKTEYINKIEEINNICNDIMQKYDINNSEDDNTVTLRGQLEQLCYALLSSILSNMFCLKEDDSCILRDKIENTLDWLIEIDIKPENFEHINLDEIYLQKINEINLLCDELYKNILQYNEPIIEC